MGESEEAALAQLKPIERQMLEAGRLSGQIGLIGTPEVVQQRLREYEEAGVQELILTFKNVTKLESMRAFAQKFIQKQ